jgi:hypothetical protein
MAESESRAPQGPAITRPPEVDAPERNRRIRRRQVGRYARAWREGFVSGAVDALRLARRRLPPETWWVLQQLSDEYLDAYPREA